MVSDSFLASDDIQETKAIYIGPTCSELGQEPNFIDVLITPDYCKLNLCVSSENKKRDVVIHTTRPGELLESFNYPATRYSWTNI